MEEKNPRVTGEFFKEIQGCGHPPTLVIDVASQDQYQYIYDILLTELFIKIRRVVSRYRQIVINTIGEAVDLGDGATSYDECRLNLTVKIKTPERSIRTGIDNSPVWSILFVHPTRKTKKNRMIFILVDKQTEEIVYRKDIENNK